MEEGTRRKISPAFKAKVVLEPLRERRTIEDLARRYELHPNQITQWKKEATERLSQVFERGAGSEKPSEDQSEKLYAWIGQLKGLEITRGGHVWSMDINCIPMRRGFLCIAAIIDEHSRYIVGYRISNTMTAERCERRSRRSGHPRSSIPIRAVSLPSRASRRSCARAVFASAWARRVGRSTTSSSNASGGRSSMSTSI
ncbi:MAG: transposase [Bacteroidetes bacterium]|nr:transposase [Bacteroidota bacterium]